MPVGRSADQKDVTFSPTSLPPERLGSLLRAARRHAQLSRRRAAKIATVTPAHLIAIERGWETVNESTLTQLLDAYGTTVAELIPARSSLTVIGSVIHSSDNVQVAASTARDDVLKAYLQLVLDARSNGTLDRLTLRTNDVAALATVLDADESVLIQRIASLLECDEREARSLARELLTRVAGPVIGVALGAAALGGIGGDVTAASGPATTSTPAALVTSATIHATAPQTVEPISTDVVIVSAPPVAEAPSTTAIPTPAPVATTPPPVADAVIDAPAAVADGDASSTNAPFIPPTTTTVSEPDTGVLPGETPSEIFYGG